MFFLTWKNNRLLLVKHEINIRTIVFHMKEIKGTYLSNIGRNRHRHECPTFLGTFLLSNESCVWAFSCSIWFSGFQGLILRSFTPTSPTCQVWPRCVPDIYMLINRDADSPFILVSRTKHTYKAVVYSLVLCYTVYTVKHREIFQRDFVLLICEKCQ